MKTLITLILLHLPLAGYAGIFDFIFDDGLTCEAGKREVLTTFRSDMYDRHFVPHVSASIESFNQKAKSTFTDSIRKELSAISAAQKWLRHQMIDISTQLLTQRRYSDPETEVSVLQRARRKADPASATPESAEKEYNDIMREKADLEGQLRDLTDRLSDLYDQYRDLDKIKNASDLFFGQPFEVNLTLVDKDDIARHITCTASIIGQMWLPLAEGRPFELDTGEPYEIGHLKYEVGEREPTTNNPYDLWIKIYKLDDLYRGGRTESWRPIMPVKEPVESGEPDWFESR